jgi:hypothetical protein
MNSAIMKLNPMFKQELNKIKSNANNQIRNKLQLNARKLIQDSRKTLSSKDGNETDAFVILGQLESYVKVRESLLPDIQLDGYTREIKGMVNKLKIEMK